MPRGSPKADSRVRVKRRHGQHSILLILKSRPSPDRPIQPRTAPRGLEAAQRPRLASANARSLSSLPLPIWFYCVSPSSASLPSLAESAPGSQKLQKWKFEPSIKAAPSRWALRGSAGCAECAAQPDPWRARPRRPR
eukprot:scaffold70352_cov53-Phaeocystis_antarctica.AAC.1